MATVTITVRDEPGGVVDLLLESDPPIKAQNAAFDENTQAQKVALILVETLAETVGVGGSVMGTDVRGQAVKVDFEA